MEYFNLRRLIAIIFAAIMGLGVIASCVYGYYAHDWTGVKLASVICLAGLIIPILLLQHGRDSHGHKLPHTGKGYGLPPRKPSVPPDQWKW